MLDEQAKKLDGERGVLAMALQDYSEGMIFGQALHKLSTELTALEDQDAALYQQIMEEIEKLSELDRKVRRTVDRVSKYPAYPTQIARITGKRKDKGSTRQ